MEGLQKFLQILNDNWTSILVCAGLIVGIIKKTHDYMSKSQEEKIELAKKQIQTTILRLELIQAKAYSQLLKKRQEPVLLRAGVN